MKTRSPAWINGVVNNSSVEKALAQPTWTNDDKANPHGKPAEMVYRLLTVPMDYPTFATTAQSSDNVQNDLNIEFIHNNVHGWVGGDYNGHMSQIPVATFDPLFWLHHWYGTSISPYFQNISRYSIMQLSLTFFL